MFNIKLFYANVLQRQVLQSLGVAVLLLVIWSLAVVAQDLNVAHTNNNTDQAMRSSFQVDPSTLGMSFSVSLGNYPGRNLSLPIALNYNSKVWRIKHHQSFYTQVSYRNNTRAKFAEHSVAGWTVSTGVPWVEYTGWETPYDGANGEPICFNCDPSLPPPEGATLYVERLTLHLPDGSSHELRKSDTPVTTPVLSGDFVAVDSSRIRLSLNAYQCIIYLPDGSRYEQDFVEGSYQNTKYIDRFGNLLTHNDSTKKWTDTMGREIGLVDDNGIYAFDNSSAGMRSIKLPGLGNVPATQMEYILVWKNLANALAPIPGTDPPQFPALAYDGSRYGHPVTPTTLSPALFSSRTYDRVFASINVLFNPVVLGEIILPNGLKYIFTYNEFGELSGVKLPSGGSQSLTYSQIPLLDPDATDFPYNQANRGVTQQRTCPLVSCTPAQEQVLTFTASHTVNGYLTTVTNPTGARDERYHYTGGSLNIDYGFNDSRTGKAFEERTYNPDGQLVRRALTEWTMSGPLPEGDSTANRDPRATRQVEILVDGNTNGQAKSTTMEYDADLNVIRTRYYDFVSVPATAPIGDIVLGSLIRREDTRYLVNDPCLSTATQTAYRNRNLIALPTLQLVRKANSAPVSACTVESPGDVVAATSYVYDEQEMYAPLNYSTPPIQWSNPGTTALGVATTVKKWLNAVESSTTLDTYPNGVWLETHVKPDIAGNITKTWDARGKMSEIFYGDSFTDFTDHLTCAYPTLIYTPVPDPSNTRGTNQRLTTANVYDHMTGKLMRTTDANGQLTSYDYELTFLRLKQVNRPDGGCTKYEYNDAPGTSGYDAYVKTRTLQSGSMGAGVWVDDYTFYDAAGRPWRTAHSEGGNKWSLKDAQHDIFESSTLTGNILRKVEKASNPFTATGVALPNRAAVAFNTTDQTCTVYDELNRVLRVRTPDAALVTTAYNTSQVTVTDQAGNTRRSVTDGLGRQTQIYEAPTAAGYNYLTLYTYDVLGNLLKVDQRGVNHATAGQCRFFLYDSLSRLIRASQPEQEANTSYNLTEPVTGNSQWALKYVYDQNGNVTKRFDARGVRTDYSYDDLNRAVTTSYTTTGTTAVTTPPVERFYDGVPSQTAVPNSKGRLWKSTSANVHPLTGQAATHTTEINSFDPLGRPLTGVQRFMSHTTPYSFALARTYDLAGHVLTQNYPLAGRAATSSYNAGGRLSSVTGNLGDGAQRTYANQFEYNAAGQLTKECFGTQTPLFHSLFYNNRLQLAEVYLGTTAGGWERGALSFYYGNAMRASGSPYSSGADNNGNVTQVEHWLPTGGIYRDQYDYDPLNRISQVRGYWANGTQSQIYQQTYTIDAWGNRVINSGQTWGGVNNAVFTVPRVGGSTDLNQPPMTNRFSDLSYDLAGNVLADTTLGGAGYLQFDAEHRMRQAITGGLTSHYAYNAEGQRVRRIIVGSEVWQVYGFDGELLAEYPVTNGAPSMYPQREYVYRGGDLLVVAGCDVARWLVKDHLGTARMLADVTGTLAGVKRHDYLPYGEELAGSLRSATYGYAGDCVRQEFTGYERDDETGLDYAQARYYASRQGRFISVDPAISSGVSGIPQSWNRYSYVGNHPLKILDPTGLRWAYRVDANGYWHFQYFSPDKEAEAVKKGWTIIAGNFFYIGSNGHAIGLYENGGGRDFGHVRRPQTRINVWRDNQFSPFFMLVGGTYLAAAAAASGAATIPAFLGNLATDAVVDHAIDATIEAASSNVTADAAPEKLGINDLTPQEEVRANASLKRLAEDVSQNGIQEPIKYVEHEGRRYIVDGHHRYASAIIAGLKDVPVQRVDLPHQGYKTTDNLLRVPMARFLKALRWVRR